jgi:macrolide transport system ATP-binding/permease protein
MAWKDVWKRFARARAEADRDLQREILAHLDEEADEHRAAGASPDDAHAAAHCAFGSVTIAIEDTRATWRFAWVERIAQDVSYALRLMRKSPGFTAVVVLSLALGIGANSAIFSVMDTVILRTLPVSHPEQLYLLIPAGPKGMAAFSYPGFDVVRRANQVFSNTFNYSEYSEWNVTIKGHAELTSASLVTGNFFTGLGVTPIAGRMLADDDDRATNANVAVISHRYWQRRFGLDAAALGSSIAVNGVPMTIVGVVPPQFTGLSVGYPTDIWLPMAVEPQLARGASLLASNSSTWWLLGMARLKPGVTEAQARANLDTILPMVRKAMGVSDQPGPAQDRFSRIDMLPGASGLSPLASEFSLPIRILMIIVGLVLLIACANVANLLLSRASARQREMAIRLALGGGRTRLLHQLLIESLLLAAIAGALGLIIAAWSTRALADFFSTQRANFAIDLSLNPRVLTFTVIVSLLTGILFGLAPALRATRLDPGEALKQHPAGASTGLSFSSSSSSNRQPLTRVLIVLQVALSLLLLAGAGLFVRTLQNLRTMDLGFNPEQVLLMTIEPALARYDEAHRQSLYREALDRFDATPGVQAASAVRFGLINGGYSSRNVFIDGVADKERSVAYNQCAPRFFEAMGVPLLAGREFNASDTTASPKVAIVSEKFARYYFGTVDVIGRRFGFNVNETASLEIVGVVHDMKYFRLRNESPRAVFTPITQTVNGASVERVTFAVRTAADPASMSSTLQREMQTLARDVPIRNVTTQVMQLDIALSRERLLATLSALFGGLALLLACVGLYGVMSFAIIRRTTEIGIRMALGARRADVIRMVLRDSAWLVAIGMIAGLAAFVLSARYVESQLFALTPTDPITLAIACAVLAAAASIAAFVPAWRAARVDPLIALRYE